MRSSKHVRACLWLLAATAVWGLSFPLIKATNLVQGNLVEGLSSVFFASTLACVRFSVAGVIIALLSWQSLRHVTKLEFQQGLGLGIFGGLGIFFQMDGLPHTSASTSAFLTQFYCLVIPIWVVWRKRVVPKFAVVLSTVMVLAGVAILAQFDWREFKMGRGEAETLLSAVFFAGQILWLERPKYAGNRVANFTVVMFAVITVLLLPLSLLTAPSMKAYVLAYNSWHVAVLVGVIVFGCTLIAYTVMNVWQPHVTATEAGLIYCIEPLCASLFALVLPKWISQWAGIEYPNETLTQHLLVGGTLITAANVLIQLEAVWQRRKQARLSTAGNERL
jgi:drug/metabolite transporter (DMT)-like permease